MRRIAYVGIVVCALGARGAFADEAEEGSAASFLVKGNQAFKEGRFAEAEDAYRRAFAKKPGYDIAGNLGSAELLQGKYRDAAEHLAITIRLFPITGSPALKDRMEKAFERAKREVATARVATNVKGARVSIDGVEKGEAPLDDDVFLDPGDHVIQARLDGFTRAEQRISVEKGASVEVELALRPVPAPQAHALKDSPPPKPKRLAPAIGLGATAIAGLGVGLGLFVAAASRKSEAVALRGDILSQGGSCVGGAGNMDGSRCPELQSHLRAHDALRGGGVAALVVGSAAAVSMTAYLLWPEKRPGDAVPKLRVTPIFGNRTSAVMVAGAF